MITITDQDIYYIKFALKTTIALISNQKELQKILRKEEIIAKGFEDTEGIYNTKPTIKQIKKTLQIFKEKQK